MRLSILYATLGGATEYVAREVSERLAARGIAAECLNVASLTAADVAGMDRVIFGCPTYDEGEMNPDADVFFRRLEAAHVDASGLRVAVFGLGESIYPAFCGGADLAWDAWRRLGASVVLPVLKLDMLEWDVAARKHLISAWLDSVLLRLSDQTSP